MTGIKKYIPLLGWIRQYSKKDLKGDLSAGLTVGIMLIPQGMAYAMLAGLPPIYGLYASTIPLIVYAFFGTSRQLSVGPVAMVGLLIATGVGHFAEPGTDQFIFLSISLALMVGVLQLLLGVFRLGFLVNFLSHPVISGFTSAAALIIGLSQLKHLLGVDIPRSNFIHEIIIEAGRRFDQIHVPTLLLGTGGILIILLIKKINKSIPGPLVAVVSGILVVTSMGLDQGGMKIVGEVPEGLPGFSVPLVDLSHLRSLFPAALTIALIGFMESIAVAKAIHARHKDYEIVPNQELIGLGLANIGGAFFSAFPAAGGFGRTAVNDQAGAKTGMASIISAILIVLTLLFLTSLFYYLPNAILASVIMVAVFGLIDFKETAYLWKTDKRDFLMLVATFVATLGLGIEKGIGVGVVLSLGMVIYRSAYPHLAILGKMPGAPVYRNIERFPEAGERDDLLVIRFDAQLFFANSGYLKDRLWELLKDREKLRLVILNADAINGLDSSAAHMLGDLVNELRSKGVDFYMSGVKGPVRDIMHRCGLMEQIGKDHFFLYVDEAVTHFDALSNNQQVRPSAHASQTNIG